MVWPRSCGASRIKLIPGLKGAGRVVIQHGSAWFSDYTTIIAYFAINVNTRGAEWFRSIFNVANVHIVTMPTGSIGCGGVSVAGKTRYRNMSIDWEITGLRGFQWVFSCDSEMGDVAYVVNVTIPIESMTCISGSG
jgi:hypothetical protein